MIEWKDSLAVGIQELDEQHKQLFRLCRLVDVKEEIDEQEKIQYLIDNMIEYACEHFLSEEGYLKEGQYEDFHHHKALHDDFIVKILDYRNELDQGKQILLEELQVFLLDWLVEHIGYEDQKYRKEKAHES